jgi:pantoate kinase
MPSAEAYSPGHISAFFEIDTNSPHIDRKGSKGAGICTKKGANAEVIVTPSRRQSISVEVNGKNDNNEVTVRALKLLAKDMKYKIKANIKTELPISQGCGMSAAGTLSSAIALSSCLGLTYKEAVNASHTAEIELRGGLGDVAAECIGGIDIRYDPGIPQHIHYDKILESGEIVLCVIGPPVKTKEILDSNSKRVMFNKYGHTAMENISKEATLEGIFKYGKEFSLNTKLPTRLMKEAIDVIWEHGGMASLAMIGNTIYAYGKTSKLVDILEPYGDVIVTKISQQGAHLLNKH